MYDGLSIKQLNALAMELHSAERCQTHGRIHLVICPECKGTWCKRCDGDTCRAC